MSRVRWLASRPKAALFDAAKVSAPKPGGRSRRIAPAALASKAPAILVAPPRTISDIAAILDQQKPDAAKIAELTTTAEAPVPGGLKGLALADFYYKRAQARALLGRSDERSPMPNWRSTMDKAAITPRRRAATNNF